MNPNKNPFNKATCQNGLSGYWDWIYPRNTTSSTTAGVTATARSNAHMEWVCIWPNTSLAILGENKAAIPESIPINGNRKKEIKIIKIPLTLPNFMLGIWSLRRSLLMASQIANGKSNVNSCIKIINQGVCENKVGIHGLIKASKNRNAIWYATKNKKKRVPGDFIIVTTPVMLLRYGQTCVRWPKR